MSTATETEPPKSKPAEPIDPPPPGNEPASPAGFDPDSFRMTVGEHLEELRLRLILSISGLFVAVLACLTFSERVMVFFCAPLTRQLVKHDIAPQVYYSNLTDPFMTYLKITLISAAAIAGPWIIYQVWLFVSAGLYPHERKMVTRYIPLSVTLFITGLVFVYVLVLPLSIKFFIEFSSTLSIRLDATSDQVATKVPYQVPVIHGDVKSAHWGDLWFDDKTDKLKIALPIHGDADVGHFHIRSIPFGPETMMTPIITIGDYIDLVLTFMLTFGVAFQLPLVLLAVVSIGIVDITFLRQKRKIIYFAMTVASAFLAPGDIVTSMLALLIPLIVLYEFGLVLIVFAGKRKPIETPIT
ncbi:MAG TPA: twin-arginine translocase subunit TatC [Tepidisphaeraceae bacterium]|jgi:Tat protein translocase TatC|nr:twin-arginine translocase subunit TatC [Tepidisphaeraceae bacterium]